MSVAALAELVRGASHLIALTGAGVSTESGIPDFRSTADGLWRDNDPMKVASIDGFRGDPIRFYRFWGERLGELETKRPNVTHRVLATLEREGPLRTIVTQNIDGLHTAAGSTNVLEVHGCFRRARCLGCDASMPLEVVLAMVAAGQPPRHACGGLIKPDVVLFGEALPPTFGLAEAEARACDTMLVLGSSLEVYPVAGLVPMARESGARVAIVNRDPGPCDHLADVVIHAELGETMRALGEPLALAPSAEPSAPEGPPSPA